MFYDWVLKGLKRGVVSTSYPYKDEKPANYRGRPVIGKGSCPAGCEECLPACLAGAVRREGPGVAIDTGLCFFCGRCQEACPSGRITLTADFEMAAASRQALAGYTAGGPVARPERSLVAKSLHIRHVDAGSCGACERETAALNNPFYDASRLGIFLTATPRHADVLLVTGPVAWNMLDPLKETYAAMPGPKFVVAAGSCAIGGGPFGRPGTVGGVDMVLPVDVYIPGCPPHPLAILDGLCLLVGRTRKEVG